MTPTAPPPSTDTRPQQSPPPRLWDVFCRVIDNHGDLGVLWRLSCQLAARGHTVRLWVDDARALEWIAPNGHPRVSVHAWADSTHLPTLQKLTPADVWVEGFGCEIEPFFIANFIYKESEEGTLISCFPIWTNLEYLTAEPYAARCHGLPSPVMSGPGKGCTKRFHYPGFTPDTGGLLREPDLPERQRAFNRTAWLADHGLAWRGETLVSLFCYEPPALPWLLQALAGAPSPSLMLVTHGRAAAAVAEACANLGWPAHGTGNLRLHPLPPLTQTDYDHLLWACDLNFVRGEDSLVRALWARKPFVWHIYPQNDGAHHTKLNAFLNWADAPSEVRELHTWWNADVTPGSTRTTDWARLGPPRSVPVSLPLSSDVARWAALLADRLWTQPDLVTHLLAALPDRGHPTVS